MHYFSRFSLNFASKQMRKALKSSLLLKKSRFTSDVETSHARRLENFYQKSQVDSRIIPLGTMGQPTCHTHPHMVQRGHLTCGITQDEYRERRETLVGKLTAEVNNQRKTHIIVIPAARKQYMSDKIPYVFRQNSDFFYLTGCLEPSAVLVMVKPTHTDEFKSILFVADNDKQAELWEGPRTGLMHSKELFTMDETQPVEKFHNYLHEIATLSKPSVLWYHDAAPANPDIHDDIRSILRTDGNSMLGDPQRALHFMRVIKSPAEIELIKETCDIGSEALNIAMSCTKPGVSERELNAVLEYSCKASGAEHLAFPPVIGGGVRATHIHYVANNQILTGDEMVLIDSGCQRWLYNSDISRTWPVSGKFSKYHRILYEIVLSVQKRLIEIIGEHRPPLDQLFDNMCRLLGLRLQAEGIISRNLCHHELVSEAFRLCPHHVSHYLGLDVHDSPLVRRACPLQANMVVTVEPGLYIRPDDTSVPAEFRGIGIRIEDDVLVTDGAPLVLTTACVKEVDDIQKLVGTQNMISR